MTWVAVAAGAALAALLLWRLILPVEPTAVGITPAIEGAEPSAPPVTARPPVAGEEPHRSSAADDALPETDVLPEVSARQVGPAEVDLWQLDPASPDALFDGNPAKRVQVDPDVIGNLRVGQVLNLSIPQANTSVKTEIISTANITPRTQVWEGVVVGGQPLDNVMVTRGQNDTHVTIVTSMGSYSTVIDNTTGEALLVDEADITANQIPFEDGVAIEPIPHYPPASR